MITEDRLVDFVRTRLVEETRFLHAPVDLAGVVHRKHVQRTWTLRACLAVPLTGLMIAAPVAVTTRTDGVDPSRGTAPALVDVAYVTARTESALANSADSVVRVTVDGPNTPYGNRRVSTIDQRSGQRRVDLYEAKDLTRSVLRAAPKDGMEILTDVDYARKVWWSCTLPAATARAGGGAVPYEDPEDLRSALEKGKITVVGKEAVGGDETLHLRVQGGSTELWIDLGTYLPVRLTYAFKAGDATPVTTLNYQWLDRTAENLAKLELTPPSDIAKSACPSGK